VSLIDFVDRIYLPRMEQQKRPSTVKGYRDIWKITYNPAALAYGCARFAPATSNEYLTTSHGPEFSAATLYDTSRVKSAASSPLATPQFPRRLLRKKHTTTALRKLGRFSQSCQNQPRPCWRSLHLQERVAEKSADCCGRTIRKAKSRLRDLFGEVTLAPRKPGRAGALSQ